MPAPLADALALLEREPRLGFILLTLVAIAAVACVSLAIPGRDGGR